MFESVSELPTKSAHFVFKFDRRNAFTDTRNVHEPDHETEAQPVQGRQARATHHAPPEHSGPGTAALR